MYEFKRSIRGRLATFCQISRNVGVLMAYVLMELLPYRIRPCVFVFVPVIFGSIFIFFPNTPQYHLKRGNFMVR